VTALEGKAGGGGGINTSDANATSLDMREGASGYVNGVKIDGAVPTRSVNDVTVGDTSVTIPPCIYDEIIEKAISNSSASSFEWKLISFTESEDEGYYNFAIETKSDTMAIILKYYTMSLNPLWPEYALIHSGDTDSIKTLQQSSSF
jgi:hypothetical protein